MGEERRKRCQAIAADGGPCRGYAVNGSTDGKCLFHSQDPKVRQALIDGRMKGCKQPERRQRLSLRNAGVSSIRNIQDSIKSVNVFRSKYFARQIDLQDVEAELKIQAAFCKLFEVRDEISVVEEIKNELETLHGDGPEQPDEVMLTVKYDGDGNGIAIKKRELMEEES